MWITRHYSYIANYHIVKTLTRFMPLPRLKTVRLRVPVGTYNWCCSWIKLDEVVFFCDVQTSVWYDNESTILIRIKAAAWPTRLLRAPSGSSLLVLCGPQGNSFAVFSQVYSTTGKQVSPPSSLQRRWQIFSISPPFTRLIYSDSGSGTDIKRRK